MAAVELDDEVERARDAEGRAEPKGDEVVVGEHSAGALVDGIYRVGRGNAEAGRLRKPVPDEGGALPGDPAVAAFKCESDLFDRLELEHGGGPKGVARLPGKLRRLGRREARSQRHRDPGRELPEVEQTRLGDNGQVADTL